jgi:hypothetical protein
MKCEKIKILLDDFVDCLLPEAEANEIEAHLAGCKNCGDEFQGLQAILEKASRLPKVIEAPRDLWPEIEARINAQTNSKVWWKSLPWQRGDSATESPHASKLIREKSPSKRWYLSPRFIIATMIVFLVGGYWFYLQSHKPSWEVASLEGSPKCGSEYIDKTGRLVVGEWLETDEVSRAKISVGVIGHVEVEPNTRIRLLQARVTNHRLDLARGKMHATIWAPPRFFIVETDAALAIDLGCEYTLQVNDDGSGLLHVTAGYVALESHGRESVVPAGGLCAMRPGIGPGTPYSEDASAALRDALTKLDFENGGIVELNIVFREARFADTFTLWHLLIRVEPALRPQVYDRMTELIPPPEGVTREGVLAGDKKMLDKWAETFGLGFSWWKYWLPQ